MAKVKVFKDGADATVRYLHNAFGQRVFKGEPEALRTLPNTSTFSQGFIDWLLKNFGWMFSQAQANTSIGSAYVYGDAVLPPYVLMGEYDNGSASGTGRTEYIWLPTPDGSAQLMGIYRNGRFFSIHTDHLGTPRLMKNDQNKVVWQRPYSAFGTTPPTGVLQTTGKPKEAMTNQPELLKATQPLQVLNVRESFQYEDAETGMRYNGFRSLMKDGHRYSQMDPIGLAGGLNRPGYVNQNPMSQIDPHGLWAIPAPVAACLASPICRAAAMAAAREAAKAAANACKRNYDAISSWMRSEESDSEENPVCLILKVRRTS